MKEPSYTVVASGGGHSSLAMGIVECLEKAKAEFNIVYANDPVSIEYFQDYPGIMMERPRIPTKPLSIKRYLSSYWKMFKNRNVLNDIIISAGSSLGFVAATLGWALGKKVWNFEVPDRIVHPEQTPRALYPIAEKTFVSWEEQKKHFPKAIVLNGVILPKPLTKPKRGRYILISLGTVAEDADIIQSAVNAASHISDVKVIYRGEKRIKNAEVISEFLSRKELAELVARSKLVITHPGYTAFDAGLNYGKPVLLTINPRYKKGPKPEDARELARILNFGFGLKFNLKILNETIKKIPSIKIGNSQFKGVIG